MPDLKISELPAAAPPGGSELVPIVQAGTTRRATVAQLGRAAFAERSVHVSDFGAVGNGTANDAPAIQAAIDALRGQGGGIVQFGPRNYRIASAISVNGVSVRLQGVGFTEGAAPGDGTWLTADNPAVTPFTFTGAAARGSAVRDIAVREIHPAPAPGWAPTAYNYFFRVEDCFGSIDFDNVLLAAVNRGIFCRNSGRLDIRRLRGQCFTNAVEVDEAFDVPRLMNLHIWPFWSSNDHVVRWQQQNGDAFIFRRCDGVFIDQSFVLGYRSMFRFLASASGVTNKFNIGQAYADFVRHGILIEADGVDGQVDSMTTQGELWNAGGAPLIGAVGIVLGGRGARVQIGNLRVDDAEDSAIALNGDSNRLDVFALRCVNYNTRNNGSAAIVVANAASGQPNRVFLGSPAQLEAATPGPLANTGTNGTVQVAGPSGGTAFPTAGGSAAAPGVSVGAADSGVFRPAAGQIALAAGGQEVARLIAGGATSLGGASGSHTLEVAGGTGANRIAVAGAAAGAAPSVAAAGSDANVDLVLGAKGTGSVMLRVGTQNVLRANANTGVVIPLSVRSDAAAVAMVPDSGTNIAMTLAARGSAPITMLTNQSVAQVSVVHTASSVNTMQLTGGGTGSPGRVGWLAAGSDANVSAVIGQPKGSGAVQAQFNDAGIVGGNARGANAVDLQTSRWSPTHVAGGQTSVVGGGFANTASGTNSTVAGGDGNAATGQRATVAGGTQNTASGTTSWVPGGLDGATRGHLGRGAWASGSFAANGDAQAGEFVLRGVTPAAAAVRLTADNIAAGLANTVNLPDQGTYALRIRVVARQAAGTAGTVGDSALWELTALLRRGVGAASTALVGGTGSGAAVAPAFSDAAAAAWRVTAAADAANGGLALSATGELNKTIRWVARIMSVETLS